jgi:uncharacterized integral membrane protein
LLTLLLVLILIAVATVFTVLNPGPVPLDLYVYSGEPPLAVVVFAVLALGVLVGVLTLLGLLLARQAELRRLRRRLRESEQEVLNLRNIPLKDEP